MERASKFLTDVEDVFFLSLTEFLSPPPNLEQLVVHAKKRHQALKRIICADAFTVQNGAFLPLYAKQVYAADPNATRLKGLIASSPVPFIEVGDVFGFDED